MAGVYDGGYSQAQGVADSKEKVRLGMARKGSTKLQVRCITFAAALDYRVRLIKVFNLLLRRYDQKKKNEATRCRKNLPTIGQ